MSSRRTATTRHPEAARATLSTHREAARGRRIGSHPPGATRLGSHRSKSAPNPKPHKDRQTQATGPPRAIAR
eukprot:4210929-Lingulodinium_polyedra.AAC.1